MERIAWHSLHSLCMLRGALHIIVPCRRGRQQSSRWQHQSSGVMRPQQQHKRERCSAPVHHRPAQAGLCAAAQGGADSSRRRWRLAGARAAAYQQVAPKLWYLAVPAAAEVAAVKRPGTSQACAGLCAAGQGGADSGWRRWRLAGALGASKAAGARKQQDQGVPAAAKVAALQRPEASQANAGRALCRRSRWRGLRQEMLAASRA